MDVDDAKRLKVLETENAKLKKCSPTVCSRLTYSRRSTQKNGRRARSSAAGGLREVARCTAATSVRAGRHGEVGTGARVEAQAGRRARRGAHARARRAVPALWLPDDPTPDGEGRHHDERRPRSPPLARRAGLQVPRKRPRKRVATGRPRPKAPSGANQVWAIDFVFDTLADGRSLKCLTVVDEWTRECLAIDVGSGIRAARVVEVLSRLVSKRGAPCFVRSDNGPQFISKALFRWITSEGIETAFIDPGKPW